jgi:predicted nucleic acid-binding protein
MSDEEPKPQPRPEPKLDEELSEAELAQLEEAPAVSALLKRSLAKSEDALPEPAKDAVLLASVQRKLRKRSKGKFYGDGWSTAPSRLNYALIAAVMLVTIVAVWLALGPTGFSLH